MLNPVVKDRAGAVRAAVGLAYARNQLGVDFRWFQRAFFGNRADPVLSDWKLVSDLFCLLVLYTETVASDANVSECCKCGMERRGFLQRFMKRLTPLDGSTTMAKTMAEKDQPEDTGSQSNSPRAKASAATIPRRNPTIKISRATRVQEKWNASLDREINDINELRHLDEFLGNQMNDLSTRSKEHSETEKIFLTATTEFRTTIKSMYSNSNPSIGYKTLMSGYQMKVSYLAGMKKASEVPLVVNLFQSMLDGFIRGELKRLEAPDTLKEVYYQDNDTLHNFLWQEGQSWPGAGSDDKNRSGPLLARCAKRNRPKPEQREGDQSTLHFGVALCGLVDTANSVPYVIEKMLVHVEMNGLYTEGIYRKSGSACRVKELHKILEKDPQAVSFENYPIHIITGLVKQWLRELPDPLMTYGLYSDFLYAADLPEPSERLRAIYNQLDDLPPSNFSTLERLIFHLVRVAKEGAHNLMSPSALAIVFAPCILRCPDSCDPLLSMKDISKTTLCVEILIKEQTRRYDLKMEEIQQLENAEAMAIKQLKLRRQNTGPKSNSGGSPTDRDELFLLERIKSIKEDKNILAIRLPELNQESSDVETFDSECFDSEESLFPENASFDSEVFSLGQQQKHYTRQQYEVDSLFLCVPDYGNEHFGHARTDAAISQSNHEAGRSLVTLTNQSPVVCKVGGICRKGPQGIGDPSVYHAVVVIFLEFFAWGLLTTPMLTVLRQTFPKHTFLMNGLIHGVKGLLSFLSAPLIGALSDVWGRKSFLLLTVFFTCAPIPLMKISPWWYFAVISMSGVFAVTFSVIFAYVADITQEHERSTAYGLVSATFAASLVTSPAIGAYLSVAYGDTLVVILATAIALLDICFILVAVPESLPEKMRPASWGAPISWEQADPFASLRKVGQDSTVLLICITVFLSYLPEAGQYSSFFLYLRQIIGFTPETVAAFIAVVGILSILAQTVVLGILMRSIGNKNTILLGLGFQILQLAWYGFGSQPWMMWAAGAVAAMSSITFPAISAIVSRNADPDQQGVVQGMITGIRGLCNGLGPALYGFVFYLFHVELNEMDPAENLEKGAKPNMANPTDESAIIPGPPFLFGACSVLLSLLVALFIPEHNGPNLRSGSYKKHNNGAQSHSHCSQGGPCEGKEPLLEDSSV
ncbi:Hippocampus abundant transcript 1 protein [Triplophysa tibetana]|uniref:Hippocampus abundant transcript 1 protein n=1 Tax=Triplophysa tibetana TaxID=1572043 RepID=A0A5A9PCT7_9TELE|nr:Hippocampus abundant transcript 1 protein [Triplophysa tibetana]